MATQTLTAFFDDRSDASEAVENLVSFGVPRSSIRILPDETTGTGTSRSNSDTTYDMEADQGTSYDNSKGFWESLGDWFFPDDDRSTYTEALNRGGIMVTATVDDSLVTKASDILEERGSIDIDERSQTWRTEGWTGYRDSSASDLSRTSATDTTQAASGWSANETATGTTEAIPIVEEQVRVGKRQVDGGRVRVRSYVVETPVNEQVNLRSERVNVERVPADRALSGTEDPFRERTIEARAVSEEAVVSKTARVTGEVRVTKQAHDRTETVQDTVRRTEVEVEDDGKSAASVGGKQRRPAR